jgi:hypothetical protein
MDGGRRFFFSEVGTPRWLGCQQAGKHQQATANQQTTPTNIKI